jgi:hypothetical protein
MEEGESQTKRQAGRRDRYKSDLQEAERLEKLLPL